MECPYCIAEIDDHAVVCRACRRDLAFFRPFAARLSALEHQVLSLTILLDRHPVGLGSQPASRPTFRLILTAVWVAAATSIGGTVLFGATDPPLGTLRFWLPDASFWLVGVWLGITVRGRHQGTYLWSGALMGLTHALSQLVLIPSIVSDSPNEALSHLGPTPLCAAMIEGMLFVTFGALLGDWIEGRRHPETIADGLTGTLARRVVHFRVLHGRSSAGDVQKSIRRWSEAFQGFAPIMALLGTIATVYLSPRGPERHSPEQTKPAAVAGASE